MSVFLPVTKFVFCNRYNNHSVNSQVPWRKRGKSVESWREIFPSFFSGKQATWHGPIFQWKTFFDLWKRGRGRKPTTRKMIISFGGTLKNGRCINECSFFRKRMYCGNFNGVPILFNELLLGRNLSPQITPLSTGGEAVSFLTRQSVIYTFGHLSYMLEIPQKIFIKFQNCFRIPTVDIYQKIYRFS